MLAEKDISIRIQNLSIWLANALFKLPFKDEPCYVNQAAKAFHTIILEGTDIELYKF